MTTDLERRRRRLQDLKGGREHRAVSAGDLELREGSDGMLRLAGYASVTGRPYKVGGFTETIKRGAFKRTLGNDPDVSLLVGHEGLPLARTRSTIGAPTLRLAEDDHGLKVDADLDPLDPDVDRIAHKMRAGLIDQMSFAFIADEDTWNDDWTERTVIAVSIHKGDVSIVPYGANETATAALRAAQAAEAERATPPIDFAALARRDAERLASLRGTPGIALSKARGTRQPAAPRTAKPDIAALNRRDRERLAELRKGGR